MKEQIEEQIEEQKEKLIEDLIEAQKAQEIEKLPLIVLAGPTAVGKTKLSIALAKKINGSIISADSMQIYKKMDIGTAKIHPSEMDGITHYLIDELDPLEPFHVVCFQKMCKVAMKEIYAKGKIPIIVGGTGFYIQALVKDIDFTSSNENGIYRKELEQLVLDKGSDYLHQKLAEVDEESASEIHANNVKRVIRALEFYHETGQLISMHNKEQKKKCSPYNYTYFVLNDDRQNLYRNIDARVDQMINEGLVEEVKMLLNEGYHKGLVSMEGLGYKEIIDYLEERCTLDEAIYTIKRDTRHFAKRQITWFKREQDVIWLSKNKYHYKNDEIIDVICETLRRKGIIHE